MTTQVLQIDDVMLAQWRDAGKLNDSLVIIDIREPAEYAQEHIPGSRNIPVAELSHTDFSTEKDKIVVFHCRLGNRTRAAQSVLANIGLPEVYCLTGGLEQWKKLGLTTKRDLKAPLDIMRQVQIVAGALVLLGIILTWISSWFVLLSAFIGAGLMFSGITGWCGMAKLLMRMPWNRSYANSSCQK